MDDPKRAYPERLLYRVIVVVVAVATGIALVPVCGTGLAVGAGPATGQEAAQLLALSQRR
jgi:hypothetical protein